MAAKETVSSPKNPTAAKAKAGLKKMMMAAELRLAGGLVAQTIDQVDSLLAVVGSYPLELLCSGGLSRADPEGCAVPVVVVAGDLAVAQFAHRGASEARRLHDPLHEIRVGEHLEGDNLVVHAGDLLEAGPDKLADPLLAYVLVAGCDVLEFDVVGHEPHYGIGVRAGPGCEVLLDPVGHARHDVTVTREQRSFCRICLATCGLVVTVDGDQILSVRGDPDDPASSGYVCAKGRALGRVHHEDRLDGARVRRGEALVPTSIASGLDDVAARLRDVLDEHGPGAVATFSGTGAFNDPMGGWVLGRLKQALGVTQSYSTSTVDAVSKTLVGYTMAGTASLIPHPDPDCRLLLLVGSNPLVSHGQSTPFANPVERMRRVRAHGEVWVVDPRRTETVAHADGHLAPRPGTDHWLLAHLVRQVLAGGVDGEAIAARADGLDALAEAVEPFTRDLVAKVTGVGTAAIDDLVAAVARHGRLAVVTGTGTTMARAAYLTEWMAWALMVVTDSFDRPGGMWFNPGYHVRLDRRRRLRALPMGEGPPSRPDIPSLLGEWPAALISHEIEAGRLRALIVVGGNPATALPDGDRLRDALARLDVLLVADITTTATTQLATHAFGCAGQLERPDLPALDMFSWQLVGRWTDAVVEPRAERPEMWRLFAGLAERLGHPVLEPGEDPATLPTEVLIRRARPAVDVDALRKAGGVLVEAPAVHGWVQDHLPFERWQLAPALLVDQLRPHAEQPPLVLAPRRQSRRMNGLAYREGDQPEAVMHPVDASPHGIVDGDLVEVASATGAVNLRAKVTDTICPGTVSIPHGWAEANVNLLVSSDDIDALTGMPVQSGTAVRLRPVPPRPASVGPTPGLAAQRP